MKVVVFSHDADVRSRIRLAIAGADADHYGQVPHGRPPLLEVTLGGPDASFLMLPIRDA